MNKSGGLLRREQTSSVVVQVLDSTVSGDLSVDMATLLLVEVDLCLEDVDLLSLRLKLSSEEVLLHLDVALLLLILVVEDVLVVAIQLTVERKLFSTEHLDHVK